MAVSSSVTGKAAGEGYIPLLGDPVPSPTCLPQVLPPSQVAKSFLQLAGKKSIPHKSNLNNAAFFP